MRDGTSPEVLRAMLTIGGGELLTISDKKGYMEYILKEKGKD